MTLAQFHLTGYNMSKPTILLVHGAWHQPSAYSIFIKLLEQRGYPVETVTLPSPGSDLGEKSVETDTAAVASALSKLIDDRGLDILLFAHSYGGVPASSAATQDFLKSHRARAGKQGGIIHVLYCAAFILPKSVSLLQTTPHGKVQDHWGLQPDQKTLVPPDSAEMFYNDIEDEALLKDLIGEMKSQPLGTMQVGPTNEAWLDVDWTYVFCERDQTIPVLGQRRLVDAAKERIRERGCEVEVREVEMDTGHSPFVSRPEALVDVVEGIVRG